MFGLGDHLFWLFVGVLICWFLEWWWIDESVCETKVQKVLVPTFAAVGLYILVGMLAHIGMAIKSL